MHSRKSEILKTIEAAAQGLTAAQVAEQLAIDRSNASRYLSELAKEKFITKSNGRPVVYTLVKEEQLATTHVAFDHLVGQAASLKVSIQQAKAAILYPPRGLHTIIFGETGTGKSMFAECMYQFAVDAQTIASDAPFVTFNCADYAQNPQLLFGHIFGIKKGAYTGASEDTLGLIAKANGGILFLDEVHRLPPEGQEMLFTFIDKGIYRPLGESEHVSEASVQIICATTESSTNFLTTFNRRIPMSITLPNLVSRSLDERYEIISLFIQQEANRLEKVIEVEKEVILAFMLYEAEANIGQVKRDLKLVCAKAFLRYRTQKTQTLFIQKQDCSLQVQKGLLRVKEMQERLERFLDGKGNYVRFEPGSADVVWAQDPMKNMQVYQAIEEKVAQLSQTGVASVELEQLIARDVEAYFPTYIETLAQTPVHKQLIDDKMWQLTNQLYDLAEQRLERQYNENARFAFALHLQSTLDRVKNGQVIVHPNLNSIRKQLKKEFQVAMDLSLLIEEEYQVELPFDEIGFISMFLSVQIGQNDLQPVNQVGVIVLMHGKQTATSMLQTAQELLNTDIGVAMDMPLETEVHAMYQQLLTYVQKQRAQLKNGILLLTDMGSFNSFATLLNEETGIRTKAISMTSTMVVVEALRMAENGRSLEETYQTIQTSFESIVRQQFQATKPKTGNKKAVIVTCFTGEGVAAKLCQRLTPVIDEEKVEIIQMQFIERETFKKHIDRLLEEYEIKAIAGTVEVDYQNIPFFSAYDIFNDEQLHVLKRVVSDEVPIEVIVDSLQDTIVHVHSLEQLIRQLQQLVHQMQTQLRIIIEPNVEAGIVIHCAFLIEALLTGEQTRQFSELAQFQSAYRLELDVVRTSLLALEKMYGVHLSDDDLAHLTQMFIENKIATPYTLTHKNSV